MTVLTVRNLDPDVKARLRVRAAQDGVSMEEEVRRILTAALLKAQGPDNTLGLGSRIHARFKALGGVELELPPRHPVRPAPTFD
jgi:antitoxin FitA